MKKQLYTIAALLIMGITANAQVGIGTTTPDASSMLDITSTTKGLLAPRLTTANRDAIASPGPANGLVIYNTTTNRIEVNIGTPGTPNWQPAGGTPAVEPWFNQATGTGATSNTQNIYQLGNVGIGTSAPQVPLEVSNYSGGGRGRIMLSNYNSGTALGAGAYIGDVMFSASDGSGTMPSSTGAVPNISGITTETWSAAAHGSALTFRVIPNTTTSALTAMTVDQNGRVGIGTTTPAANLEIVASNPFITFTKTGTTGFGSNLGGYAFRGSNGAGTNVDGASITAQAMETWTTTARGTQFVLTSTSLGSTTIRNVVLNTEGGWMPSPYNATTNANQSLGTTGNRWSTAYLNTAPIVTSDGRLKTNIKNASYGLADVMKMRPVTYNWKTDPNNNHMVGFIAQEMEKIIPEAVEAPKNDSDHYGVRYEELIPVLTKAIQEQQAEIDALKKRNEATDLAFAKLAAEVKEMKEALHKK